MSTNAAYIPGVAAAPPSLGPWGSTASAAINAAVLALNNPRTAPIPGGTLSILAWPFNAKGDGVTDNTDVFQSWWTALMAGNSPGYIPAGNYRISGQVFWDCAARTNGVHIFGDGQYVSRLTLTTTTSPAFKLYCSGGTGPTDQVNLYYSKFHDFSIYTDISGIGAQIGSHDFASGLGSTEFANINLVNANTAGSSAAVTVEVNQTFDVQWRNMPIVGNPAGYGTALKLIGPVFNHFDNISVGNAENAIYITAAEDAAHQGFVYGNTFTSPDLENYINGVVNDSTKASKNLFLAGTYFPTNLTGYDISSSAGVAGAGNVMTFDNPNLQGNGLDPSNYTGVMLRGYTAANSAGVWAPATGVDYTNNKGVPQQFFIFGGTVTGISINGYGPMAFTGGASPVLQPGDRMSLTYAAAPSYLLMPQV